MAKYNTIIFDLDGTLLDTLDDLMDAVNYALTQKGWPVRTKDEIRQFVGNGVAKLVERAVPAGTPSQETTQALELFKAHYELHKQDKTAPYPGILELLKALHDSGRKLAVVSNKFDPAVQALMPEYFPGLIDAAAGESETSPKKPDPTMVFRVMELLGADPAASVYVGDSEVDLQTAHNSGLPCIAVTWGFRDRQTQTAHGATVFADTPAEIMDLV